MCLRDARGGGLSRHKLVKLKKKAYKWLHVSVLYQSHYESEFGGNTETQGYVQLR